MCVELDLTKPLIPEFNVEGQTLSIVYESLGCLCTKCGMIGHRKEVCGDLQRKAEAGEMEVEVDGEKTKDEGVKEVEMDRWKIVQGIRRPRKSSISLQEQQSGSRFSILREEAGDEVSEAHVQKRAVSDGSIEKTHREGAPSQPQQTGKAGTRGEVKKGPNVLASRNKDGRKDKEEIITLVLENANKANMQKNKMAVSQSQEFVPESNLELYKWQEVRLSGKENLQPGAITGWMRKTDDMDTGQVTVAKGDEGQIERMGVSTKEECVTPAPVD
ncbi:hypothetical protein K1719_031060 [Acacia pycnantha]|nr:hypothetical protein K1719_031060 [Acacia pycnantha]